MIYGSVSIPNNFYSVMIRVGVCGLASFMLSSVNFFKNTLLFFRKVLILFDNFTFTTENMPKFYEYFLAQRCCSVVSLVNLEGKFSSICKLIIFANKSLAERCRVNSVSAQY